MPESQDKNKNKFNWKHFIPIFFLATIIAAAMKGPDKTVPPVSDSFIIAVIIYAIFYLLVKGVIRLIK